MSRSTASTRPSPGVPGARSSRDVSLLRLRRRAVGPMWGRRADHMPGEDRSSVGMCSRERRCCEMRATMVASSLHPRATSVAASNRRVASTADGRADLFTSPPFSLLSSASTSSKPSSSAGSTSAMATSPSVACTSLASANTVSRGRSSASLSWPCRRATMYERTMLTASASGVAALEGRGCASRSTSAWVKSFRFHILVTLLASTLPGLLSTYQLATARR
mmetsp:Transcript_32050/g.75330  ORF Transcript_32050/g.75330 Transcript_32050/m.75330 type:complete len:221 (-) Transcript_32050:377-1039(-)